MSRFYEKRFSIVLAIRHDEETGEVEAKYIWEDDEDGGRVVKPAFFAAPRADAIEYVDGGQMEPLAPEDCEDVKRWLRKA